MRAYSGWAGRTSRISFSFTDCSPELAQASWHVGPAGRTGCRRARPWTHIVTNRAKGTVSIPSPYPGSGPTRSATELEPHGLAERVHGRDAPRCRELIDEVQAPAMGLELGHRAALRLARGPVEDLEAHARVGHHEPQHDPGVGMEVRVRHELGGEQRGGRDERIGIPDGERRADERTRTRRAAARRLQC